MKINIVYKFQESAWGGGNQFLKALRSRFIEEGIYTDSPDTATHILFNSHQEYNKIEQLRKKHKRIKFIHRIDGPMRLYNDMSDSRDQIVYNACSNFSDAVVFQSNYSKDANLRLGLILNKPHKIIHNAPDELVFYQSDILKTSKIKIISTSFSNNINKGFNIYKALDDSLDFSIYKYTFIGNSPIIFKNISNAGPLDTTELAATLRCNDIYITASKFDPCSNSLLEAISSGIYPLALNSGGHPELINKFGGELFNNINELLQLLKKLQCNIPKITTKPNLNNVTKEYIEFIRNI